jgi:uncharacterized caspase-like protein
VPVFRLFVILVLLMTPTSTLAKSRVAFIVGNSSYENAPPLPNPANDAKLVARTLEGLGFDVSQHSNLSRWEIAGELSNFLKKAEDADLTLFYFAGHGMQFEGRNYLLGTDAQLESELDIQAEALDLDQITRLLRKNSRAALIFVDACRDNPVATDFYRRTLPATRSASLRGLAELNQRFDGAMVTFSASPGQVAYDGQGAYSPFAEALAKHLPTPNIEILTLMKRVIGDVKSKTDDRQVPMISNDLSREIYLREVALRPESATANDALDLEQKVFDAAMDMETLHGWARYFAKYPNGRLSALALDAEHEVLMREASYLSAGFQRAVALEDIPGRLASQFEERLGIGREDVIAVQALLKRLGYYPAALDGSAGPATRNAIRAFQSANDVPETGMITRATAKALGLRISKLSDRPQFSSFRKLYFRMEHAETLGMDPRLFALGFGTYTLTNMIYGYLGDRLYIATGSFGPMTRFHPGSIDEGASIYPVSVGSLEENRFIYELVRHDRSFWQDSQVDKTHGPMIGLYQPPDAREPASGWTFVGDTSSRFRRWDRGQPDDFQRREDYVHIWFDGTGVARSPDLPNGAAWNDTSGFYGSVILEVN